MKGKLLSALSTLLVTASLSGILTIPADAKKSSAAANAPAAAAAPAAATKADTPLKIVSISSPIKAGSDATATVQAVANAMCNITVKYKSGPATAAGLKAQRADKDGKATWTWKVAKNCSPGDWPVDFTANAKGYKGTASGTLKVEK
jgi:hypothetical protein